MNEDRKDRRSVMLSYQEEGAGHLYLRREELFQIGNGKKGSLMPSCYYTKKKKHCIYTYFEAIYFNLNEDRKDRRSVMLSYQEEGAGHLYLRREELFQIGNGKKGSLMPSCYYTKKKKHSIYTYFEAIYFNLNEDRKDRRSVMLSYQEEGAGHLYLRREELFQIGNGKKGSLMPSCYYTKKKKHSIYTYFEAIHFNLSMDGKDRRSVMLSYQEE